MEWWGILIIEKAWLQKLNFKMKFQYDSPPSNSIFKRVGIIHWPTSFIISSRIPSSKLLEGSLIQLPTLEPPQTMGSTDGCWGPNRWRHWPCNIKTHHGIPPFWLAPSNHPFLSGYVIIQNIIGSNKHKFSHWTLDTDVHRRAMCLTILHYASSFKFPGIVRCVSVHLKFKHRTCVLWIKCAPQVLDRESMLHNSDLVLSENWVSPNLMVYHGLSWFIIVFPINIALFEYTPCSNTPIFALTLLSLLPEASQKLHASYCGADNCCSTNGSCKPSWPHEQMSSWGRWAIS